MSDRSDGLDEIMSRLGRVRDHELASLSDTAAATALFEEVISMQQSGTRILIPWRSRPRRRAVAMVAAAAVTLALAMLVVPSLVTREPAAAGIAFSTEAGYIVAEVTDPLAASEQLRAAFAEYGLDIDLQLVPVSPSLVGTVVAIGHDGSDAIDTLQQGTCVTGGGGCPIGLRIPVDYSGWAEITLGRQAEPDEQFLSAADGFGMGEALHCSGLLGVTVEEAMPELQARGLTAMWRLSDGSEVDPDSFPAYFVTEAIPWAEGEMLMWIAPSPATPSAQYVEAINQGC